MAKSNYITEYLTGWFSYKEEHWQKLCEFTSHNHWGKVPVVSAAGWSALGRECAISALPLRCPNVNPSRHYVIAGDSISSPEALLSTSQLHTPASNCWNWPSALIFDSLSPFASLLGGTFGPASRLLDHLLPLSNDASSAENLSLWKMLSPPLNYKRSPQSIFFLSETSHFRKLIFSISLCIFQMTLMPLISSYWTTNDLY